MSHTRETRASASEIKFLIDPSAAPDVRAWARTHMAADPHGAGPHGDEYDIATLYLDTREFHVFERHESYGRAKYRVRRYGALAQAFLERKLRKPNVLIKRRTMVPLDALERLGGPADGEWEGSWFERRVHVRALAPVCQVRYHRMARLARTEEGLARLTLDSQLRALPAGELRFSPDAGAPFLEDQLILELKFRQRLPALFRRLVEACALEPAAASKYRLAMTALGHESRAGERASIEGADASYV
jgi:hypothetical protein